MLNQDRRTSKQVRSLEHQVVAFSEYMNFIRVRRLVFRAFKRGEVQISAREFSDGLTFCCFDTLSLFSTIFEVPEVMSVVKFHAGKQLIFMLARQLNEINQPMSSTGQVVPLILFEIVLHSPPYLLAGLLSNLEGGGILENCQWLGGKNLPIWWDERIVKKY